MTVPPEQHSGFNLPGAVPSADTTRVCTCGVQQNHQIDLQIRISEKKSPSFHRCPAFGNIRWKLGTKPWFVMARLFHRAV
jgi:hypothetical protein